VCAAWKAVHDALVKRLVLRPATTDEAMGMLVRSFPAVTSLEMKWTGEAALTDEGLLAVSNLRGLTSLDLPGCRNITDEGVRAVSHIRALTSLDLACCIKVTDEGVRAVSHLPALTSLDLAGCNKVTAAGVQALRNTTAAPSLHIKWYPPLVDEEDAEDWEEWE
jgi:hypothetical protein